MKKIFKHPLFSGSFLMIGGSLVVNGVNYVYHLVMGRVMGPEVYGGLASVFSILYIVSIIPASSSFAVVKFISKAKDNREQRTIFTAVEKLFLRLSIYGSVLIVIFSPLINNFLHLDNLLASVLVAPIFFLSLVTLANQSTLQGLLEFVGVVGPNLVSAVGKLTIGLLFVYLGWSLGGALFAIVISGGIAYLYSKSLITKVIRPIKADYNIKPFLKYALPVLIQALAFTSLFTFDLILARHFLPAFDAGLYAALSTLGKIIFFAAQPLTAVMFPIISGRKAKGEGYRKVFYMSFVATVAISVFIVIIYYLLPDIAIGLLYGKDYLAASSELVWMGIFMSVYTASYLLVNFVLSLGRTKIVVLPLIMAITQIVVIYLFHNSILQIIQVSLASAGIVFVGMIAYLGYNELSRIYAKSQ